MARLKHGVGIEKSVQYGTGLLTRRARGWIEAIDPLVFGHVGVVEPATQARRETLDFRVHLVEGYALTVVAAQGHELAQYLTRLAVQDLALVRIPHDVVLLHHVARRVYPGFEDEADGRIREEAAFLALKHTIRYARLKIKPVGPRRFHDAIPAGLQCLYDVLAHLFGNCFQIR